MLFKEIPGLHTLKDTLIHSVSANHIAHAQLFVGHPGGVGLPMALAYATYLNCTDKQENDACGRCSSCLKMNKLAHPDVMYIFPTAGGKKVLSENLMKEWREFVQHSPFSSLSDWLTHAQLKQGNIPVEEARQLVQKLALKAYEGDYKIVIIWSAEFLHNTTSNALLKLLEEPPSQTIFLLVTTERDKILPTITSRTQTVSIPQLSDNDIQEYLINTLQVPDFVAQEITFLADRNLQKAIQLIDNEPDDTHSFFVEWMRYCFGQALEKLVPMAELFDAKTKEQQKTIIEYSLNMYRELLIWVAVGEDLSRLQGDTRSFIDKFSKAIRTESLEQVTEILNEAYFHLERNVRAKIIFLDISWKISQLIRK